MFHMFSVIFAYDKVVRRVVLLIKILVMNFFGADKRTAKNFFGNQNVFKNVAFPVGPAVQRVEYFSVSLFENKRLFSVLCATPYGAVFWVFMVGYKYCSAVKAGIRRGCCLFSRYFWRRVSQFNVVTTAISFAEMLARTAFNFAKLSQPFRFFLLLKTSSFLPSSITYGIAKRHLRVLVNFFGYFRAALSAYLGHNVIRELMTETIIQHYSLEHEGRK